MNKRNSINSITRRLFVIGLTSSVCTYFTGCQMFSNYKKKENQLNILEIRDNVPPPYVDPPAGAAVETDTKTPVASVPVETRQAIELVLPKTIANPNILTGAEILSVDFNPVSMIESKKVTAKKPEPLPEVIEPEPLTHAVSKGDTLWDVARAYGISSKELAAENTMNLSDILKVGAILRIPPGGVFIPIDKRPPIKKQKKMKSLQAVIIKKQAIPTSGKHIVKKGDTLWDIAQSYGIKVGALKKINSLTDDLLYPGQLLIISRRTPSPPVAIKAVITTPPRGLQNNTTVNTEVDVAINLSASKKQSGTNVTLKNLPHFISDGDTLKSIAEMYGSKVEWILNENSTIKNDNDLKNGLEIQVPCPEL